VNSFVFARSAPPVDVAGAISFAAGTGLRYRPNVSPGVLLELFGSQYPGGKIFNKAAFTAASAGQQGNFGRNVLRGFGAFQTDFAVQRQFRLTEKLGLRFRSEFFNIFNHPNFGPPSNDLTSPYSAALHKPWRAASAPAAPTADSTPSTRSVVHARSNLR